MNYGRYRGAPLRAVDPWDGLLLVDKPAGPTSHDIVDAVRGIFHLPKVGHGGTLDPAATGLLILLLGRATKISQQVMSADKVYEGTLELGLISDTHDADGEVLERRDPSAVTRAQLEAEMQKWTGDVMQMPPMVSAIKQGGVPLYKMARKGVEVEREPRLLHIYQFALLDFASPWARFRVRCSKGTYVRTLCHDIGQGLGCGGLMRNLNRTRSGTFDVKDAVRFEDLVHWDHAQLQGCLVPLSSVRLQELP